MATIRDRLAAFRDGGQATRDLQEQVEGMQQIVTTAMNAYQSGSFDLPPEQLKAQLEQLREYDPAYVDMLIDQQLYDQIGGTGSPFGDRRKLAVQRSERLWQGSPIGQLAVQTWTAWGLGDSVQVTTTASDAQADWDEFWEADRNAVLLGDDTIHELSDWLLILGNQLFVYYSSTVDGLTTVRTLDQDEVQIITSPKDSLVPWFYKREFQMGESGKTIYYPDWSLKFGIGQDIKIDDAWGQLQQSGLIPKNAERADMIQTGEEAIGLLKKPAGTDICVQHVRHWRKDRKSLWGWPLTTVAGSWLVAHRRMIEAQISVRQSVAQFVRKVSHTGGSRAQASLIASFASTLSQSQAYDTNPPAAAGSTAVYNKAVDMKETPLTTGAGDFEKENKVHAWHVGAGLNMNTTTMGLDAARYATAVQMDRVQSILFGAYGKLWGTQFSKMAKIVLSFRELYGGKTYKDQTSTTSIDSFTLSDFPDMVPPITQTMAALTQAEVAGIIPTGTVAAIDAELIRPILYALGAADVQELTSEEAFTPEEPEPVPPALMGQQAGVVPTEPDDEMDDDEAEEEPATETAIRAVFRNYLNDSIDLETVAENVILEVIERRAQ